MLTERVLLAAGLICGAAYAQDLPKGKVIDVVICAADRTQSYALYVPSRYTPDKKWPVLLAFDARANGSAPVQRYQAAAEKYGWIVAGSNNSRNGPAPVSMQAAQAMEADVTARFSIDPRRIYAAGQSGGARFAIDLVWGAKENHYAGVIPSSAGFPRGAGGDLNVPFAVFGTAGTEDFNYLELRRLDRVMSSPHHVKIFLGGHTWLPSEVAVEALEWMEVQAMRSGTRDKDDAMIDHVFTEHKRELAALTDPGEIYQATLDISLEFAGLRDVSTFTETAKAMLPKKEVQDAMRRAGQAEIEETRVDAEIANLSDQLDNEAERQECLDKLKAIMSKLAADVHLADDTPARRSARRIVSGVLLDNRSQKDPDYRQMLDSVRF